MSVFYDSQSEFIWISPDDRMPDVCCNCGMFTYNRVPVKHHVVVEKSKSDQIGCVSVLLTLLVHVVLGPIGSLISSLMHHDDPESDTQLVKEKVKVKIAQCQLCKSIQPPEVIDVQQAPQRLMFLVHPQFKTRFEDEKRALEQESSR